MKTRHTSPFPAYLRGKEEGIAAVTMIFPPHENWKVDRYGKAIVTDRDYMRGYIEGWLAAGGKPCRTFPHPKSLYNPTPGIDGSRLR